LRVADFDYELPPDRVASIPAVPRDAARLLLHARHSGRTAHLYVRDLPSCLAPGDLLVVNDTRVLPHRLIGHRKSGGRVEILLLRRDGSSAEAFVRPARKLRAGEEVELEGGALTMVGMEPLAEGRWRLLLRAREGDLDAAIARHGRAPLPPYIERADEDPAGPDRERYQTIFAHVPGAVAAPTAGLHFTPQLRERLAGHGVGLAAVTLHVGEGTFEPVRVERVEDHRMHAEVYVLPEATAEEIRRARGRGGRVVAVGTTAARVLETRATADRLVTPGGGETTLFLYPGCRFQVVDALLTNFHLPRSTLLMLVAAFAGRERILALYREAIEHGYRFYSFGDAMLLL
jgi:S-adenosylmethionine:tRNA ribosyltransferase-isomerase